MFLATDLSLLQPYSSSVGQVPLTSSPEVETGSALVVPAFLLVLAVRAIISLS